MPRARLTPEEREARRKARARFSFSDAAYRHYDPHTQGYGQPEDWERIAELLFSDEAVREALNAAFEANAERQRRHAGIGNHDRPRNRFLAALDLADYPASMLDLKTAFRTAMMKAHPDRGGTNEAARTVMEAFSVLKRRFA